MNMKDVKAITIPEGTINKIEDANGNIIWGSQSAFPYRRLEYIHFAGNNEYLATPSTTKSGYFRRYTWDIERNNVRQIIFGVYDGTLTNTLRRYYCYDIQPNSSGCRASVGDSWSTSVAYTNIPLNTKLRTDVVNSTVSSKPRMSFNLTNANTDVKIINTLTINGTTNGSLTNQAAWLMANHNHQSGSDYGECFTKGKIYYFEERTGSYQGTLTHEMYPCQRKSDGLCGLFDVTTNTFYPMSGTDIYNSAAGPVVDEYWNLQA